MKIPPCDINNLIEAFQEAAEEVVEVFEDIGTPTDSPGNHPALLAEAMVQLAEVLKRIERDAGILGDAKDQGEALSSSLAPKEVNELGDYGLQLLSELAAHAAQLGLEGRARELQDLTFPFALWIVRHGGELQALEPVVNALAMLANQIREPTALEELSLCIGELVEGVAPALRQDLDNTNPLRPWRVLLLNYSIVATRSHQPTLMEKAFEALIQFLPEEAPYFFREGMEQMDALNYPPQVREVMERYYQEWGPRRTLH